jgi:multidrug efflux pump subunit AcrA (membrane-fusion protein)
LQSAEAQVQSAEANLRIAKNQLNYTELRAPDDAVVTATAADPGQVVGAGQNMVEISRSSEQAPAGAQGRRPGQRRAAQESVAWACQ